MPFNLLLCSGEATVFEPIREYIYIYLFLHFKARLTETSERHAISKRQNFHDFSKYLGELVLRKFTFLPWFPDPKR